MGCLRLGGTVSNTSKGGGTEKRGGKKDFKRGGKLGQGVGVSKREAGTSFQTMKRL